MIRVTDKTKPCKLCECEQGTKTIIFPQYQYVSGDFVAPVWPEHEKYYCPNCEYLWSSRFDDMTLAQYGHEYVQANFESQRRPAEERMKAAPRLLRKLVQLSHGARYLDYGVGYNVPYIYELRGRGVDVWGCDISARVPYSRFVMQLPQEMPPVGSFDGIYSLDVAEHLSDIVGDYTTMYKLLKPGGYMLHSTYWLHELWSPDKPFPDEPSLRNPWHVSICSEKTMRVIAEKTGLVFVGSIPVDTDTGCAYLLRKPGRTSFAELITAPLRKSSQMKRIDEHVRYVKTCYPDR